MYEVYMCECVNSIMCECAGTEEENFREPTFSELMRRYGNQRGSCLVRIAYRCAGHSIQCVHE